MRNRCNVGEPLFHRLVGCRHTFSRFVTLDITLIALISFALIADELRLC
ncbi:MAG: hypothetical protein KF892_24955 [Rhizobacter sp.]|nr:hypothetical protein [Rhizobacter sp.]